jgi:hypothetical protein
MTVGGVPTGAYLLRAWYPERARWYEFGVCDNTRVVDFGLDSAFTVRDVSTGQVGTCI